MTQPNDLVILVLICITVASLVITITLISIGFSLRSKLTGNDSKEDNSSNKDEDVNVNKESVSKKFYRSARWVIPAILAGIILIPDDNSSVLIFSFGIILSILVMTHVIRKLLFYYIDLEELIDKANNTPIGSAIVFASIVYLVSVVIQSSVALIK
jgi:hypothetical protein